MVKNIFVINTESITPKLQLKREKEKERPTNYFLNILFILKDFLNH